MSSLAPLLALPPGYTLTSTASVGWGASLGAGPCGSVAAQHWGLLLNLAFLHSCVMTQPSNASHSGRLLFPPRNHFQVTCLGHFPAALLTFAHLTVTLRAQAWEVRPVRSSENCEDYPCPSALPGDRDGWVNGAVGAIFIFKPGSFVPVPGGPLLFPALEGVECREDGWLAGSGT